MIPRKDEEKGDKDDFTVLKRYIDKVVEKDSLAKVVSIHNLNCLTSVEKSSILLIACGQPSTRDTQESIFLITGNNCGDCVIMMRMEWLKRIRSICWVTQPIQLDSHYQLLYIQWRHLGFGLEDEKFLAPYYWFLPAICHLDIDHEQSLFLKNLKYGTRELVFCKQESLTTRISVHSAFERSTTAMPRTRTRFWSESNRPYSNTFLQPEFRRM